jgi:hypothetical protein
MNVKCYRSHAETELFTKHEFPGEPGTSIYKTSGAHDLRDGTFTTVAEDGKRKTRRANTTGDS